MRDGRRVTVIIRDEDGEETVLGVGRLLRWAVERTPVDLGSDDRGFMRWEQGPISEISVFVERDRPDA